MPRYAFRCPECGLAFDVSRPMSRSGEPAACPTDGATAERVFVAPDMVFKRSTEERVPSAPPSPRSAGFSHHGHSHGPGVGHHAHGAAGATVDGHS